SADKSQEYRLTISTNPSNAQITIDGQARRGSIFTLPEGNHTVQVSASGYETQTVQVDLDRNRTLDIDLQRQVQRYTLRVRSNVSNAQVYVDGERVGTTNYSASMSEGVYSLRITAPGYRDYINRVELNQDRNIHAVLQPQNGTIILDFPDRTANVFYYIDGNRSPVTARNAREEITLSPGTYRFKFSAGGLESPEIEVEVEAGASLRLVPRLSFDIQSAD
ncbi:MAG: PEGA domain-containing protein, partial [Spirochaeta sp.]